MTRCARVALFLLIFVPIINSDAVAATSLDSEHPDPKQAIASAPTTKADVTTPPTIRIPRVSRPPKLEDFLNNTPREAEAVITGFRQREPHDGEPVSRPTTAYASYDDKNLYVIIDCKDDPSLVRARLSKREDIFSDDVVGVFLDTFHDRRRAYEFFVNPLGIQADGTTVEGQNDDFSYDTLWHSEGKLTEDGFVVFISIPFKSLRFSSADEQSWGFGIFRNFARNNEQAFWPYITRRIEGFAQQLATAEGLDHISAGRNIQIIPYGSFARSRFLDDQVPAFSTETNARAGVDAKIIFRDSITADFTFNPDFSQVESDEPQVTVNQRFEVFFPEKRPFFLENAGYFQTPETLFFSRRIADPQFGARVTGKLGPWAIAALALDDRAPGQRLPADHPSHGDRAAIGVVRVQREFAKQSNLGFIATSRDFGTSSNRVLALDTRIKLSPTWVFQSQGITSLTRELDGRRFGGSAYSAGVFHSDRHVEYNIFFTDRSPGFRSQLGFIPRVDVRQIDHFVSYRWRPKKGKVQAFGPNLFTLINWDREGRVQDWRVNLPWSISFSNNTHIFARRSEFFELFQGRGFREHSNELSVNSDWLKWLSWSVFIGEGKGVNFFPAGGLPPFSAKTFNGQTGFSLRLHPQLRVEQTYIYSRLSTEKESAPSGVPAQASIFNNHIVRSKVNYQFTRALSLRAILDYNAILPNTTLVDLERTKRVTGDVLVTYLLNPGTALYVGYTDRFENLVIDRGSVPTSLRRTISPTTGVGRQFFMKVSYLFRF